MAIEYIEDDAVVTAVNPGRGPVECARAVALVSRELRKAIPGLEIADSEPHNSKPNCYMSLTLESEAELPASVVAEWEGTVFWRSTKNPYRPGHKRSNWFVGVHFIDEVELPEIREADIVYETCRREMCRQYRMDSELPSSDVL